MGFSATPSFIRAWGHGSEPAGFKGAFGPFVLAVLFAVVFLPGFACAAGTLNGAGATFPYPVYSAWAYGYRKASGVKINYQSIGSGGGQRQVGDRTIDFGASDDPLSAEKLDELELYQFPAVIGGVVPVVNIKGIKAGGLRLDAETLCGVFLGGIKTWNDEKIRALNPGLTLPDEEITVVRRSDGSGTTAIFTAYLSEVCPAWRAEVGAGKAVDWPSGIGGKGNEGVANYVKRMQGSIGYVEFAYAKQNKLTHTLLKNSAGSFVEPGMGSFKDAAAAGEFKAERHFHLRLTNAPGKNSWPIAGATFILLAREKADINKKVVRFFDWAFKAGDGAAERLAYVPLPEALKNKVRDYWKKAGIY